MPENLFFKFLPMKDESLEEKDSFRKSWGERVRTNKTQKVNHYKSLLRRYSAFTEAAVCMAPGH